MFLICGSLLCGAPVLLRALGGEMGRQQGGSQGAGGKQCCPGDLQGLALKPEHAGWTSVCVLGRVPSHTWLLSGTPWGPGAGGGRHTGQKSCGEVRTLSFCGLPVSLLPPCPPSVSSPHSSRGILRQPEIGFLTSLTSSQGPQALPIPLPCCISLFSPQQLLPLCMFYFFVLF